jgi:hypothetical protein
MRKLASTESVKPLLLIERVDGNVTFIGDHVATAHGEPSLNCVAPRCECMKDEGSVELLG